MADCVILLDQRVEAQISTRRLRVLKYRGTAHGTNEYPFLIGERGLSVPKDIGLVCYDDVEHLAVLSPFLTVVDQPAEIFGSLGAQLLFERIADKAGERSRRIVLQADLIVRESCCAKTGVPARTH